MLRTRGGNRFEGYGNVKVSSDRGHRSGWQLTCAECKALSEVVHRSGSSYPPKVLVKMFAQMGWKVGNTAEADICPACVEKRRERHREERKQYAKGSVDRLLDMIRQIDLMLASNVTIDYGPYQPQIAVQLKSLFETAYLCGMLRFEEVASVLPPPTPDVAFDLEQLRARERELEAALDATKAEHAELLAERDQLLFESAHPMDIKEYRKSSDAEQTPEPEPPPPPSSPPPAQEERKMSSRTATFLAGVRKQVFKNGAVA